MSEEDEIMELMDEEPEFADLIESELPELTGKPASQFLTKPATTHSCQPTIGTSGNLVTVLTWVFWGGYFAFWIGFVCMIVYVML